MEMREISNANESYALGLQFWRMYQVADCACRRKEFLASALLPEGQAKMLSQAEFLTKRISGLMAMALLCQGFTDPDWASIYVTSIDCELKVTPLKNKMHGDNGTPDISCKP